MIFPSAAAVLAALNASALAATTSSATSGALPVARDTSIIYNARICANNIRCASIDQGQKENLITGKDDESEVRILLGFDLPLAKPTKCTLVIPRILSSVKVNHTLTVSLTDNSWDELTANGFTKSNISEEVGRIYVEGSDKSAKQIDVSKACLEAKDGRLSLFVDSDNPAIMFDSRESTNAAKQVFALKYSSE
ncbi:hypothetical protein GQ54DRAFT_300339 [Martensiomyces pterosporus]|nr:hypothetical protein GQ54DRAFT_300339 [Martensiomyces pterosporus]